MAPTPPTVPSGVDTTRSGGAVVLVLAVVVVVIGLVVDGMLPPPSTDAGTTLEAPVAAGRATCAAGALEPEGTLTAVSIADHARAAEADGWAALTVEAGGDVRRLAAPDATGRAVAAVASGLDGDALLAVRWQHVPVLLSRRQVLPSGARVPGSVEGPCPTGSADRWIVPGVVTAGGASALLHLANPTDASASIAITFTTPDGPIAPTRLSNLVVGAHGRLTLDLNEYAPEEPDLGVEVLTRTGQVVVEAEQVLESAVGGVDGRSLVVAHTEPALVWTVPWVSTGEGESAWLWVTNPTDEPTEVGLVVHTEDGPVVPPVGGEVLAPHSTYRIDLRGALGEVAVGGVTVRSQTDVPIVVGGAVVRGVADDPERGGIAVLEALVASGGRHAALSAVGDDGRVRALMIANPGDAPATVDVAVVGANPDAPTSVVAGLEVAAGAWVRLDLTESVPGSGAFAVLVDVTDGIAAAATVTSTLEGPLDLTAIAARAFPTTVTASAATVRRSSALLHPMVGPTPTSAPSDPTATAP